MTPLYALPPDDAPISEWCRPVSATLTTRTQIFLGHEDRSQTARQNGSMAIRMRARVKDKIRKDKLTASGKRSRENG